MERISSGFGGLATGPFGSMSRKSCPREHIRRQSPHLCPAKKTHIRRQSTSEKTRGLLIASQPQESPMTKTVNIWRHTRKRGVLDCEGSSKHQARSAACPGSPADERATPHFNCTTGVRRPGPGWARLRVCHQEMQCMTQRQ